MYLFDGVVYYTKYDLPNDSFCFDPESGKIVDLFIEVTLDDIKAHPEWVLAT